MFTVLRGSPREWYLVIRTPLHKVYQHNVITCTSTSVPAGTKLSFTVAVRAGDRREDYFIFSRPTISSSTGLKMQSRLRSIVLSTYQVPFLLSWTISGSLLLTEPLERPITIIFLIEKLHHICPASMEYNLKRFVICFQLRALCRSYDWSSSLMTT